MKKKKLVLCLLSGLLVACASSTPTTLPTPTGEMPTQTASQTFAPFPSPTQPQTPLPTAEATPTPLPENDLPFEHAAQLGGGIFGITIAGDVAYVGMGPRVAAIDISQPEHPQLIGQSEPLPGLVSQLLQISSGPAPLLVVNAGKYLVLVDVSNTAEPKPVQQLAMAGVVSALVWDERGSILYAGSSIRQSINKYTGLISAVRITPDHRFEPVKSVAMPEWPLSLALGEGSLFAGAEGYEGGLYTMQVKTPGELSTPRQVVASTSESPLQPTSMQVIGERLYLSYKTMEAYDITNPDRPVQVWAYPSGWVGKSFNLAGDQIYIFGWTILSEYVRQTVTAKEPIVGSPIGATASVTAMHKGDFLVAYHDLEIYATADPENLQLVGSYQAAVSNALEAVANDEAVFVVDDGTGDGSSKAVLRVFSLPALEPLGQVTTEFPTGWTDGYRDIALDGDRLYLASEDGVWAYDVSSPQPGLLGNVEIEDGQLEAIAAIQLVEQRLLVTAQVATDFSCMLRMVDMTDPQNPVRLGDPLTLDQWNVLQIIWNEAALYVLLDTSYHSKNDLLYAIDFANQVLTVRGTLSFPEYLGSMALAGDLVAVTGAERLSLVSTIPPGPLKLLAQGALPETGVGAAFIQDMVLVLAGESYSYQFGEARLLAFDIHDPASPVQVGEMDMAISLNHAVSILVSGSYVVLANGAGGVEVLGYGSPTAGSAILQHADGVLGTGWHTQRAAQAHGWPAVRHFVGSFLDEHFPVTLQDCLADPARTLCGVAGVVIYDNRSFRHRLAPVEPVSWRRPILAPNRPALA